MTDGAFTLLLPVYGGNAVDQLAEAFRSSVHRQELKPDAVVLVEDGPLPGPLATLLDQLEADSPSPVTRVKLPENVGLAAALNAGLEVVTTEFVARMDSDDVSAPERFARQLPVMRERRLDVLGTGLVEFQGAIGKVVAVRTPPVGGDEIRRTIPFRQPFHHPSVVLRRSTLVEVGGYPTGVGRFEDYVLFARLVAAGAAVDNLPDLLLYYRADDGAYARRGGLDQLRSEIALQRELRRAGITSRAQRARNLLVRAPYRLIPPGTRAWLYRRFATRRPEGA
ncbi:glycosyltransferase [Schumannella luteola]|uniref:Glycosyltransferase involved in cell wall biosynthesis n=1 Tax=Schumannella luteola TaxID=472059 RepID=A0A852YLU6_9MICO|nr:glycosyltransferase [Schumannella luteola]NYG98719.1 glycosyltransferase involved in cell wall biosynthesis [Schumannella luteola]TPX04303.1 glycosyltransferase [Schumannella luteola]